MALSKNDPDYIRWLLAMNDRAVERAILCIYARQTEDEQNARDTKHSNGMGFSSADARLGSYYARWIKSGKSLTGHHLTKARMMSHKYVRQLVEVATERMAAEAELQAEREAIQAE